MGVTTVYVTHDQTEAMTMADHIVLMKAGEIMQEGTPGRMYDHPRNLFAAGFLGTPQIITFDCRVKKTSDQFFLAAKDFSISVPPGIINPWQELCWNFYTAVLDILLEETKRCFILYAGWRIIACYSL